MSSEFESSDARDGAIDDPRHVVAEPIVTARLRLDPLIVDDADEMIAVYADPLMYEFTGGEPPTADSLRRRYEMLATGRSPDGSESWLNWIVRPIDGGEVGAAERQLAIGAVQATIVLHSREAWIAWEIGVASQGLGYAGEAASAVVRWLGERSMASVRAAIHPDHGASQAVAVRAGLHRTDATDDGEEVWVLG